MSYCQRCGAILGGVEYTLCLECELRFGLLLLRLGMDVVPLHDSLDATLHPGGHSPTRIILSTPQTPIRLDVLDLIDILDSTSTELLRRLDGVDALEATATPPMGLRDALWHCAAHVRLARLPDSGMYMDTLTRLAAKIERVLDPPEQRRAIGVCELCATPLTAGKDDQWVTCPVCKREQQVLVVKLHRLSRLCFDASRSASASWIAKAFTDSGLPLRRNTINQWAARGKLLSTGRKDGSPQYLYSDVYRLALAPNSSAAQATSALRQTLLQRVASLVARRAYMLCGERSAENL
ncbi:hypothetical protein [Bifidobacterium tibiigranuli]|jgi:hypothetical protein|uniref:hypothetical protein n=1 Tax=Bifidobacterium tibiigranuli TaxID=2172043 RepID=UPI0026EA023A|nr:hypothetical protein [Bifidobacterium tibiigranuli]MCI2186230.1 hypothetical protein [Bifidobacterium tibiigranuli]MCI2203943.1 hypothetical protein [Bifidobacterium tibiigranuli]